MIPPSEGRYVTLRPLEQLSKKTKNMKNLRIFNSKDDKIVFNYYFGKLKIRLNHVFP